MAAAEVEIPVRTTVIFVVQIQHKAYTDGRWIDYNDLVPCPTLERAQFALEAGRKANAKWLEHNTTGQRIVQRTIVTTDEVVA